MGVEHGGLREDGLVDCAEGNRIDLSSIAFEQQIGINDDRVVCDRFAEIAQFRGAARGWIPPARCLLR